LLGSLPRRSRVSSQLFAFAFGRVPLDIIKYQGLTPQGCQVLITRTLGGLTSFCMFERTTCKM
ncbi:MAG: hypothetical protein ACK53Y_23845, partial [bacterium]